MSARQPDFATGNTAVQIALIAPNEEGRREIAKTIAATEARVVHEFADYPGNAVICGLFNEGCGIIVIDLDAGLRHGLDVIETISKCGVPVTVIACSGRNEADIVIHAMRAGAREFLAAPLSPQAFGEAFERASARMKLVSPEYAPGKIVVFQGVKGGVGATTLATNFAVALMREDAGSVVLVDMHAQLGETALNLGLAPQFSIGDALGQAVRLDAHFLSTLLAKHESGLMVLGSSDVYGVHRYLDRGADKLLGILRDQFAWVVVDAGPCSGSVPEALFEMAETIYLIAEASVPALRNTRRLLSWFGGRAHPIGVEVVLNRFNSRMVEIDEASAVKALGQCVDWKIPSDYVVVRGSQNLGVPLMNQECPLARVISQMARAAAGIRAKGRPGKAAAETGEKWKFWTSSSTKPLSTVHS